jgi:hypothetical protein
MQIKEEERVKQMEISQARQMNKGDVKRTNERAPITGRQRSPMGLMRFNEDFKHHMDDMRVIFERPRRQMNAFKAMHVMVFELLSEDPVAGLNFATMILVFRSHTLGITRDPRLTKMWFPRSILCPSVFYVKIHRVHSWPSWYTGYHIIHVTFMSPVQSPD